MPYDERVQELISAYSLGVLDGEDLKELEDFLAKNPGVYNDLLRENEEAFSQLSYVVKGGSPSPELRTKLLNEVKASEKEIPAQESPAPFWERLQPLWLGLGSAAAVVIIALLIGYNISLSNRLNDQLAQNQNLENQLLEQQTELAALEKVLGTQSEALAFLENPNVVIINMVKTEPGLKAVGRMLWNTEDDEALFYGINLPQIPEGKTYQLWAIAGDVPKNAGVFQVDSEGNNHHVIKSLSDFGDISTFAVSLEPAGGVPSPTGEIYLAGEI